MIKSGAVLTRRRFLEVTAQAVAVGAGSAIGYGQDVDLDRLLAIPSSGRLRVVLDTERNLLRMIHSRGIGSGKNRAFDQTLARFSTEPPAISGSLFNQMELAVRSRWEELWFRHPSNEVVREQARLGLGQDGERRRHDPRRAR